MLDGARGCASNLLSCCSLISSSSRSGCFSSDMLGCRDQTSDGGIAVDILLARTRKKKGQRCGHDWPRIKSRAAWLAYLDGFACS